MTLTRNALLASFLTVLCALAACFFSFSETTSLTLLMAIFASLCSVALGRYLTGSFVNLLMIFLVFNALYGLSGPLSVHSGVELNNIFPMPYMVDVFLRYYSIALAGLIVGLIIVASYTRSLGTHRVTDSFFPWNPTALLLSALSVALIASAMEIINLTRAGGIATLFAGKATYQSDVAELTLTLPSTELFLLSVCLFGLSLSRYRGSCPATRLMTSVSAFVFLISPVVISLLILGRRGPLLASIVMFLAAYLTCTPLKTISARFALLALIVYIGLGLMYGARWAIGYGLASGDWTLLEQRSRQPDFWITSLNPATNEFGSAFGNFNTYLLYGAGFPRLGETYLSGLAQLIPRFIWPEKPISIAYEFRDTFFPQEALGGSIAGTGFSSVLEAYMNFRGPGIFFVYGLVAIGIGTFEHLRARRESLLLMMMYLLLMSDAIAFHRSSMGTPLVGQLLLGSFGVFSYLFWNAAIRSKVMTK